IYFVLVEKVIAPLAGNFFSRMQQRRIEKYGYKVVSREDRNKQRINKVLGQYVGCWFLLFFVCSLSLVFIVLGIRRIQIPKGSLENDTITIFFMILSFVFGGFLSLIIAVRIFKKKNGTKKTLKYALELKKQPRPLTRYWLKICGINDNDIQSYLSEMPKK
ncbi:MAG: hypothetical protein ACYSTR_06295, partial [Planctomycetota bacterium]